ncbi:MAG: sigma-70 family RNA polymerase sigma factor [Planctomycetaceae bacterium]|nr:sigma-70 family RNA polymerase sigma factor [Planctomycetaceae bacterium]MBN8599605.1 sigma-70 family RNA polymerase sigma factor [Planctomycetota bacterium]
MSEDLPARSSDNALVDRFRKGDEDAALKLYYRYSERLLSLAARQTPLDLSARFDPEDIVQSVFRTFFRRVADGQYEAPEGDELWKLLLVIALNKVRNRGAYHRSQKRNVRNTQSIEHVPVAAKDTQHEVATSILCLSLQELIDKQPESHRDIIRLRIDGHDIQTITNKLSKSKRTIERVLQNFRKELLDAALVDIGSDPHEAS